ncbi:MAG: precorrin-3B synthase [Pseudophaeobacter sp. bin_em_oilr2.035]|uniref:Precorrin-3B synthase n=1 Tax=Phaeobacter gallaeciensis TaxID=60890 RepID=A0ABD4XD03_9RHOB|nr:precorrin-3B synthase [Phaeobacter gallaeciensis]MDF1772073.1 precorrin-3B synthase [Pseudophaeobacter sp. bin_em_oilr2.035]MDE4146124.1 precorrin-3B synthase [Phaeobacter gallaeciensis]MDE4158797.1 precorrin-3B synthase [Phaeobacter gallaeciensis]MDE4162974.1 precorrin-3B synthase [Phaeobacter gallaeciensis]MDE4167204.1 precorrin-3B synthase [Phaeobacter gallaeciensis]
MSAAPKVYGWCPGALRPMMSGDGLVVRIRAPMGRLSPEQARGVAELSRRHGNGLLDLSARANLQMRGVKDDSHAALLSDLRDLGLLDTDEAAEARHNVLLTPFWTEGDDRAVIARRLASALTAATDLTLPGKFGFAVDCGTAPVLRDAAADIRIERDASGLILRPDGAELGLSVTRETAVPEALNLARWFLDTGGAPDGRGRMRQHLAKGTPLPSGYSLVANVASSAARPGQTGAGQLVAVEFGQMLADTLTSLADHGALRLTPWRMLLIEGASNIAPLPGLILDAADPRLRVSACTGGPGCLQALSATRDLARDLAPHVPEDAHLHVSGCAKGCAHPGTAPLTLTATANDTFTLIRNGSAADQPIKHSLSARALRAAPELLTEGS